MPATSSAILDVTSQYLTEWIGCAQVGPTLLALDYIVNCNQLLEFLYDNINIFSSGLSAVFLIHIHLEY